jgi:hypothetical protein
MARQLQPVTDLARSILESGKPAYVVAAEVGINYNRLLDYADGRMAPTTAHASKLTAYLVADQGIERASTVIVEPHIETTREPVTFCAVVREISTRGTGALVVLTIDDELEVLIDVWTLATDSNSPLLVGWNLHGEVWAFKGQIERMTWKRFGIELRIRVIAPHPSWLIGLPVGQRLEFAVRVVTDRC